MFNDPLPMNKMYTQGQLLNIKLLMSYLLLIVVVILIQFSSSQKYSFASFNSLQVPDNEEVYDFGPIVYSKEKNK